MELLYSGHHWGMKFVLYRGVALSQGLSNLLRGVSSLTGEGGGEE